MLIFNNNGEAKFILYSIVNTNSKYKEDDFTGSIAVNCFKKYEYTQSISAMKHTHVNLAPLFPPSPSTHPSPQSG